MGGFGSGGMRIGSGQRKKDAPTAKLHGTRRGKAGKAGGELPIEPVEMPADLPNDQRAVWSELAPHALAARTLTPATVGSFRDLCRAIVVRNGILAKIQEDGWTYVKVSVDGAGVEHSELKKHPLVSDHRGWEQRVEAGRARFKLAPIGKPIVEATKPDDPFAEFETDGAAH